MVVRAQHYFKHISSMEQVSCVKKDHTQSTGAMLRTKDKVEHHGPSSTIVDWLKDPKNEFMHLGPVNRSCSSVHNRPLCNFLKNSFYASLRSARDDESHRSPRDDDMEIETLGTFKTNLQEQIKLDNTDYRYDKMKSCDCLCESGQEWRTSLRTRASTLKEILVVTDAKKEKSNSKTFLSETTIESNRKNKDWYKSDEVGTAFCKPNTDRFKTTDELKKSKYKTSGAFTKELTLLSPDMTFYLPNSTKNNNNEIQQSPSESEVSVTESMSAASTDSHCSSKHLILNGNALELKRMADEGFNFNFIDEDGYSALHYGAMRGNRDIISLILDNGGNVWRKTEREELAVELSSNLPTKMLLTGATMFYKEENGVDNEHRLQMKPMCFEL